jgi:serine protease Do
MQPFLGEERVFAGLGITGMAITEPMAFARRYPDTRGVVVTGVRPGYPPEGAKPAIERGDVIVALAGKPVTSLDDLVALERANPRTKDLLARFRRGRRDLVTVLDMTRKPEDRRTAELPKAWLGLQTQVLTTEVAKALGVPGRKGFRVARVLPGSKAEAAGLQAGDLVVALDGERLEASNPQDAEVLRRRIEEMDVGAVVRLGVIRDGAETEIAVTLEETPETAAAVRRAEDPRLEYRVREVTYMDRVEREWPAEQAGVLVHEVSPGSWAQVAGLQVGDLILSIDDRPVLTIEDFEKETARVAAERPARVKVFVRRGIASAFVFVAPDWPR